MGLCGPLSKTHTWIDIEYVTRIHFASQWGNFDCWVYLFCKMNRHHSGVITRGLPSKNNFYIAFRITKALLAFKVIKNV